MKTTLIILLLLIPGAISESCHPVFRDFQEQMRFWELQMHHGACAVSSDFTHAYRCNNGEKFRVKG